MTKIKVLKSLYGDGFIYQVMRGERSFTMVIDGGPQKARSEFKEAVDSLSNIDLMVLTHFDSDHIDAMLEYLTENKEKAMGIGKYWLNLPQFIKMPQADGNISYDGAITFFNHMESLEKESGHSIDWRDEVVRGTLYEDKDGLVKITVLSPTTKEIKDNEAELVKKEADRLKDEGKVILLAANDTTDKEEHDKQSLESLSEKKWRTSQISNKSSIVMLIESYDGTRVLFTGDTTADLLAESLQDEKLKLPLPLKVNLLKMPHHGSKNNVSNLMLSLIDTDSYLITTNGGDKSAHHPDRAALAKILLQPSRDKGRKVKIYLNYPLSTIQLRVPNLISKEEIANPAYNFEIREDIREIILGRD